MFPKSNPKTTNCVSNETATSAPPRRTFDAVVGRLEVRLEVFGARLVLGELRVGYAYLAASSSGAAGVGELKDVGLAAEMSVVELDAAADAHAAVVRARHDDHLVERARRVERLRLAERRVVHRARH